MWQAKLRQSRAINSKDIMNNLQRKILLKAAICLSIASMAACGGGGGDSYDYAKLNGTFTCKNVYTNETERIQVTFSSSNAHVVSLTFPGLVQDVNDVVGMGNGYPMYSEFVANSTDAVSFIFTTDGYLTFGKGPQSRINEQYVMVTTVSLCKRP